MLLTLAELLKEVKNLKDEGKRIVFTNGCFDIIHAGHTYYLARARAFGDVLIVGLNSDDSVVRLKGQTRPINKAHDRAAVLGALKSVDYVVFFEEDTPYNLIAAIKPDILAKGGDYKPEDIVGADIVKANGGSVIVIPFLQGRSTTSIIDKINSQ